MFEGYIGSCPTCESYEVETIDQYDTRLMFSGDEVYCYDCQCKDCGTRFKVTKFFDGRKDEIEIVEDFD